MGSGWTARTSPESSGAGASRINGPHCGLWNATKTTSPPGSASRERRWEKKIAEGATLVFLDESGFSLKTTKVRTWGRCGQTPIIPTKLRWEHLSVIGAITTGGQFLQHTHRGAVRSAQVVEFLAHVLRHVAGEVVVVLDRAMIHRSKAVQAFVLLHERLSLVYLPPYAPELNPIELIWADLKRNVVGNFCALSVAALKKRLTVGWQRIRRRGLPRAFIRGTPFTASLSI